MVASVASLGSPAVAGMTGEGGARRAGAGVGRSRQRRRRRGQRGRLGIRQFERRRGGQTGEVALHRTFVDRVVVHCQQLLDHLGDTAGACGGLPALDDRGAAQFAQGRQAIAEAVEVVDEVRIVAQQEVDAGGARPHIDAEIDARKQEARQNLALHSALPGTEEPLWQTLELSYFARHDAADIAWHARSLWRHIETRVPIVRARASSVGDGLQVLVYSPDRPDLFARICGYFDGAGFSIQDAKIHTTRAGFALDTFQIVSTQFGADSPPDEREFQYRDLISLVETQAARALASDGPLPEPRRGRVSRRVRSFPVPPRVSLTPDERAQHWLLSVSASDRTGLLYGIARVLARNHINLQLAKVSTLGERVEDTFLVDGPALQQMKTQVRIETEILDAVAAPVS